MTLREKEIFCLGCDVNGFQGFWFVSLLEKASKKTPWNQCSKKCECAVRLQEEKFKSKDFPIQSTNIFVVSSHPKKFMKEKSSPVLSKVSFSWKREPERDRGTFHF